MGAAYTIAGLVSTATLYAVFQVSENLTRKKARLYAPTQDSDEKMNLRRESDIGALQSELTKPVKILVPVRNPNNLAHLTRVLETVDDAAAEIIVLSAKIAKGLQSAGDEAAITEEDRELFTPVILLAEKYGKTVKPLLVVSNDPFYSIVQTAQAVGAAEIVMGVSGSTGAEVQLERLAMTWGMLRQNSAVQPVKARVIWEGRELSYKLT